MRQAARLLVFAAGLLLTACATDPVIRTDFDRTADFFTYQTFGFAERPGTDTSGYASLLTQRLERAIGRELIARGYEEAKQAPDLLVDFHARAQDKLRVTAVPPLLAPYPRDYGGYRRGFYDPWFGYDSFTDVQSYTEGTLSVDLIDRARRRVVWQGVATDRFAARRRSLASGRGGRDGEGHLRIVPDARSASRYRWRCGSTLTPASSAAPLSVCDPGCCGLIDQPPGDEAVEVERPADRVMLAMGDQVGGEPPPGRNRLESASTPAAVQDHALDRCRAR